MPGALGKLRMSRIIPAAIVTSMLLMLFACCYSNTLEAAGNFVYVAALEKECPDEPSPQWSPTLYRISIEEGKVASRVKLAEQGAAAACESVEDGNIRVVIHEGIFANGTRPGELFTREIIINRDAMCIEKSKTSRGVDTSISSRELLLGRRKIPGEITANISRKDRFLAVSSARELVFVLSNYYTRERGVIASVRALDKNTFKEMESIPLGKGDRELGPVRADGMPLLDDRYLVCLFGGASSIGNFASGYVMVVDTVEKTVKYAAIGSDPAFGTAY